ncbi:secretory subunit [Tulasnella sp. 418]|nr:secretory subunit [Tulasnella sp. 418]
MLPALVGRWWFGSRKYTKDGVVSKTAEIFFKAVREETHPIELINILARAWEHEGGDEFAESSKAASGNALGQLEATIKGAVGDLWTTPKGSDNIITRRAKALLYAHLLRIPVTDSALAKEQTQLLLQTPAFLNSMLSMALAHNWLTSTIHVMHLHANLAQAVFPGLNPLLQFPDVQMDEAKTVSGSLAQFLKKLEEKQDPRHEALLQVANRWGKLDCVDAQFKVIGERIITPGAIVQLVFKLRVVSPTAKPTPAVSNGTATPDKEDDSHNEELKLEEEFLTSKQEAEDLQPGAVPLEEAHAPYWPSARKPQWWIMIGDQKQNRVIVPPMKFGSVPFTKPGSSKDYRTYKLQFQAPPQVGVYTFQVNFISDTFLGSDIKRFVVIFLVFFGGVGRFVVNVNGALHAACGCLSIA